MVDEFGVWLRGQTERDDPVGDLARDITADDCAEGITDAPELAFHMLYHHGASIETLAAFDKAVIEWVWSWATL